MIKKNLVFDFGFHNGDDSSFYLKKGFTVVALEANPDLIEEGKKRFIKEVKNKKLFLINKAVTGTNSKRKLKFYVNPKRSDWSSCYREFAENDGSKSKVVSVESVSIDDLCKKFGVPLYVKVDIEGCDVMVAEDLYSLKEKPKFVSFETSRLTYDGIFSWLYVAGYKKFQLINQLNNSLRMENGFTKHSSGFFGDDLPKNKWLSFDEALVRYIKYKELKIADNQELALGWLDIHASL